MLNIDWSLIGPPVDVVGAAERGYEKGRERLQRSMQENALAGLSRNPSDPEAMATLWRTNPAIAASFENHQQKRTEFTREPSYEAALQRAQSMSAANSRHR